MSGGLTAHRPNASDDFNFGVVLTARPLRVNEVFEVRLDKMVSKWAGSIEIGKRADFAILEDDPFDSEPDSLKDIAVWGTVQGGRIFEADKLS